MSATTTSTAARPSTSSACGADLFNIPVQDPAVGMGTGGNHTEIMSACCGKADVISYYKGCGLYCLAEGQSVNDVIECLYSKGAAYQDVFYRNELNATATVTGSALPTSVDASVVATGGSTKSTGTGSSTSSTSTPGAAANVRPELGSVTTMGLTIGALLLSATAFGAFQL
ncbi:uncharacterized protein GGS22DRAFT_171481 [Annulohypoxylon maeteangense]|uniref:uncharacterized protein n=1 Tax=Annulohypoxylon maeteangense TaxID=1927788 RepID=UPI00200822FF|nr:uncharacterized protein GGS22DRAFT_171481 [Annulohypoxylon maeteangense]KAI0882078.1 hypothetical protein GGS22DRAFT_171481 [Annulohypoxylon maeteangense]